MREPPPSELLQAAEGYAGPAVDFLRDLIKIQSVNGQDPETPVALRVMAEADRLGLGGTLAGAEQARQNVLVQHGTGPSGFGLVAHLDTVAPGDENSWKHPPYGAEIIDGTVFGRGSADNKAGIACSLYTLALLRDRGLIDPQRHRIVLAGVVDEESGASSPLGVRFLLDEGLLQVDAAIYTYASEVICIGHRGLLRLRLRAEGVSVHSGSGEWDRGEAGVNAVAGMADCLLQLEKLRIGRKAPPAFKGLSNKVTPGTVIRGGDWPGMVPSWAEATVDIRLLPGVSGEQVLEQVGKAAEVVCSRRPGLKIHTEVLASLPGAAIPRDHRLVRAARGATREVTGEAWEAVGAGPANEGYMLIGAGIPTLCGFGPRGGNAHAPDEWVSLDSVGPTIAMYTRTILTYLGKEE